MGLNGAQISRQHAATVVNALEQALLQTNGPGPGLYRIPPLCDVNGRGGDYTPAIPPYAQKEGTFAHWGEGGCLEVVVQEGTQAFPKSWAVTLWASKAHHERDTGGRSVYISLPQVNNLQGRVKKLMS